MLQVIFAREISFFRERVTMNAKKKAAKYRCTVPSIQGPKLASIFGGGGELNNHIFVLNYGWGRIQSHEVTLCILFLVACSAQCR